MTSTAQSKKQRLRLTKCVRRSAAVAIERRAASPSSHFDARSDRVLHTIAGKISRMQETRVDQGFCEFYFESHCASCRREIAMRGTAGKRVTSAAEWFSTGQLFCVQLSCASLFAAIFGKHSGESIRSDSLIGEWRRTPEDENGPHAFRIFRLSSLRLPSSRVGLSRARACVEAGR